MKKIILLSLITLLLFSCKKRELEQYKFEIINETIVKTRTTAELTVQYNYPSTLEFVNGIISEKADMSDSKTVSAIINDKTFFVSFQELKVNTQYFYKYEYSNSIDIIQTDIKSFSTDNYGLPIIETAEISIINSTYAVCGGNVTDDCGLDIIARGICWSTNQNPTIDNSHTTDGTGLGLFISNLTDLDRKTTYYVKAYATNGKGTSYGSQVCFTTNLWDDGILPGVFSISSSQQVCFSQANLQYQASTNTWRFAEHQWDLIGDANKNISSNYNGWIDLFGWGTSGYNHGARCYMPYSTSWGMDDYYAYGLYDYNLFDQTGTADWGYNAISNSNNIENQWRVLTRKEWRYIFHERATPSGIFFAMAKVNGINGVILLPDNWNSEIYVLDSTNTSLASFKSNVISELGWDILENAGAVLLPATGGTRSQTNVDRIGFESRYWSSSRYNLDYAYDVCIRDSGDGGIFLEAHGLRAEGENVRLVQDYHSK